MTIALDDRSKHRYVSPLTQLRKNISQYIQLTLTFDLRKPFKSNPFLIHPLPLNPSQRKFNFHICSLGDTRWMETFWPKKKKKKKEGGKGHHERSTSTVNVPCLVYKASSSYPNRCRRAVPYLIRDINFLTPPGHESINFHAVSGEGRKEALPPPLSTLPTKEGVYSK